MAEGWEDYKAAPLEFFHGRLMNAFHDLRMQKGDNPEKTLTLDGIEFSSMVAAIKIEVYEKYPNHVSEKPILKADL